MAFSTLTGAIRVDSSGVESGVASAEGSIDSLTGKAASAGKSMQKAGAAMTAGITAPLVAMGGAAARQAANFDQAMQQSIAVMGDVDEAMREDLEQTAREVATSTTRSHEETAESFYFLASAGLTASEAMEALPQVAAFAEAGQMDMAEATDVATNVMSAYGIEAENMAAVTDVMTETVTNHNQTMEGMSAAFRNAAPAAASMGVEIEELAAFTGALGDVGIQAEEAGTALNSIMRRMAKRSGEAGQVLDELGIKTTDANGNLLPMVDIIEQLEEANMNSAQSAAIFGRQMSAGNALVDAGADQLREYQSNLENSEGATQSVAETQRETLNAELDIMRSNLQDAGVAIGAHLLPMLSTLTGYVKQGAQWFGQLNESQQKVILALGGVAAAIGPVLAVAGTLLTMLPAMSTGATMAAGAFGTMWTTLLGPIGLVIAALGLFGAAYATNFMGIGDKTDNVVGWVIENLDLLKGYVLTAIGPIGWLYMAWESNFLGIQQRTSEAVDWISNNLDLLGSIVLAALGPIGWFVIAYQRNFMGIGDATDEVIDGIVDGINWLLDKLTSIPSTLKDIVDRIPGVDGDEVADKLFPPKPTQDKAEETGRDAGASAKEGAEDEAEEASLEEMFSEGDDAYQTGYETGSELGAGAKDGLGDAFDGEPIKGEMTPAMRQALEEGVEGYVSDPEEIQDAPTEIREELFDAVAQQKGGASAEALGVSRSEFMALQRRFGGADISDEQIMQARRDEQSRQARAAGVPEDALRAQSGTDRQPDEAAIAEQATGTSRAAAESGGLTKEALVEAIVDAMTGLALRVESSDETLEDIIEETARIVADNRMQKEAARAQRRGTRGGFTQQ